MPRKLTIEFVREQFLKRNNWILLSESYTGWNTKLDFWCVEGNHSHSITWGNFNKGTNCGICAGIYISTDFVKSKFQERGWTLVSKEYINSRTPLEFRCKNGHFHTITWDNFLSGRGCGICRKKPIEVIREEFAKIGWDLISTTYKNCKTPITFKCKGGHVKEIQWRDFQRGVRCVECLQEATGKKRKTKITIDFINEEFARKGWRLISTKYENAKAKLDFECEYGHTCQITWSRFSQKGGCPRCHRPEKTEERIKSKEVSELIRNNLRKSFRARDSSWSKTRFSDDLAEEIIRLIGVRPESTGKSRSVFELDHVIPKDWFNHNKLDQIHLCWAAKNFQWLKRKDNAGKANRLTKNMMLALNLYQIAIANLAEFRPKDQEALMKKLDLWMTPEEARSHLDNLKSRQGFAIQLKITLDDLIAS